MPVEPASTVGGCWTEGLVGSEWGGGERGGKREGEEGGGRGRGKRRGGEEGGGAARVEVLRCTRCSAESNTTPLGPLFAFSPPPHPQLTHSISSLFPSPLLSHSLSQVRGSDAANLAATRQAQADIWLHQFPNQSPSDDTSAAAISSAATSVCSGRRLFVVDWPKRKHGIGSQLSIMSAYLSLALIHNRTLVPTPGTYLRANHSECLAAGNFNSFDCYFFPLVARSCEERVREVMRGGGEAGGGVGSGGQKEGNGEAEKGGVGGVEEGEAGGRAAGDGGEEEGKEWEGVCADYSNVRALLGSDRPIVRFCGNYLHFKYEADAASIEVRGRVKASVPRLQQVHWWRAQSLRFMLRWPSAYLCHVSNRSISFLDTSSLATSTWPSIGFAGCTSNDDGGKEGNEKEGEEVGDEDEVYRRVGGEVYMPRPVVSVHVRQGDKQKEMRLSSFRAYMLHVQRLRLRVPDVHYVWLSTEMQSVIDQLDSYNDWTFLYSKNKRQLGSTQMLEYEKAAGLEQLVGVSFANLLIASECDFFVGPLGSNWNRLINNLRDTNGRVNVGYVALNTGEW
ncbi:unnamed protein product [Closterium sp. Yama58-4]|nr:unnamed protein product [Closterium sp. Yama58-4]